MTSPTTGVERHLRRLSDDALVALLERRPDLALPAPADLAGLARRAAMPYSVMRAVDALDLFSVQVMETAVALQPVATQRLREATEGSAPWEATEAALERLEGLALVWRTDDDRVACVGSLPQVVTAPLGLGRPASDLAESMSEVRAQRVLATMRRDLADAGVDTVPDAAGRRAPAGAAWSASEVAALIREPAAVHGLLAGASPRAQELVRELAAGSSRGTVPNAMHRPLEPDSDNPVTWLMTRGLLIAVGEDTVELPREVGVLVRGDALADGLAPEPPALDGEPLDQGQVDAAAASAAGDWLRHTTDLLELWTGQPPTTLKAGGLGVRETRRTAKALGLDEETVVLLIAVAGAAGLVAMTDREDDLVLLPTPAYDMWLDTDEADRWLTLASAWLDMSTWPAMVLTEGQRVALLSGEDTSLHAARTRSQALGVLLEAGLGAAPSTTAVAERLMWEQPHVRGIGGAVDAVLEEARHLGLVGRGALSTAATYLLGDDAGAAVAAVRRALPDTVDHVLAQADHTLVAPGPLPPELARGLRTISDRESAGAASVHRVTEASLRRALDSGMSADEITTLLTSASRTPVPQSLLYLIDDTARRYGRLRLGPASVYIRCDDETHLAEVLTDRRLRGLGLRRVAPTVLVADLSVARSLGILRDQGYSPVVETEDGRPLTGGQSAPRAPTPTRRGREGVPGAPPAPDRAALAEIVDRMRRADLARSAAGRVQGRAGDRAGLSTAQIQDMVRAAAEQGHAVWMSYVNRAGVPSQRVVEPLSVSGGLVEAYDHMRAEVRTFLIDRMVSVVPLDAPAGEIIGGDT